MKTLSVSFKLLVFTTMALAGATASAVEQSYAVKCRFFQADNMTPPVRDGDMLTQTVGNVSSIRLRSGQAEMSITIRNGFEQNQYRNQPTVQAIELVSDYSSKYIFFYRNAVSITYKDHIGTPVASLACQGVDVPKIADRLLGNTTNEIGVMEASFTQSSETNASTTTPAAPAAPAVPSAASASTTAPPANTPAPAPSSPAQPLTMVNGLPAGLMSNIDFLKGN